ncbi:MAG: stringent starvation protein A [Gammaproteobacteria bacterium]|nr:stringent starvation protein A [Gammaproteobacteria bacterium]
MAVVASRRSIMTLFSEASCPYSHRVRLVLAVKGITVEINDVDLDNPPEDLIDLNPYRTVPTLVDRDLVLYGSQVIMEYLDERFPHPPLMAVDPVSRAKSRLMIYRINKDWYGLLEALTGKNEKAANKARKMLRDSLTSSAEVFAAKPYFLNDDLSLVDCCLAPLLWRLRSYDIELPKQARAVLEYANRVFDREDFQESLTEIEEEMMD